MRYAPLNILAWPCVLIAAYGVYQLCHARAEAVKTPEAALARYENFTGALAAQNKLLLSAETLNEAGHEKIASNAAIMLQRAPLDELALVQLALSDFKLSARFSRPQLLDLAKDRSARNDALIRARLRIAMLSGEPEKTVDEVDLLWRVNPDAHEEYNSLLVTLYKDSIFREAIHAALSHKPKWGYPLFRALLDDEETEPYFEDMIPEIVSYRDGLTDPRLVRNLMNQMLTRMMRSNDMKSAYALWLEAFASDEQAMRQGANLFFAPMFKDSNASAPFNWQYVQNERVSIEAESAQGGIFISSSGSSSELVLRQILPRRDAPQLLFTLEGIRQYTDRQGHFEWQFFCAESKSSLGQLKLDDDWASQSQTILNVPEQEESCEFIDARLWAIPGLYKRRISLILSNVSLTSTSQDSEAR